MTRDLVPRTVVLMRNWHRVLQLLMPHLRPGAGQGLLDASLGEALPLMRLLGLGGTGRTPAGTKGGAPAFTVRSCVMGQGLRNGLAGPAVGAITLSSPVGGAELPGSSSMADSVISPYGLGAAVARVGTCRWRPCVRKVPP